MQLSATSALEESKRTRGTNSRLGGLQLRIKQMVQKAADNDIGCLTWPHIRQVLVFDCGGAPGDTLKLTFERSAKRALHSLVKRGDVLVVGGKGGPSDPYRYTTVEAFASAAENRSISDTSEAKAIVAELIEVVLGGAQ
jgi:hypothetical protein